MKQEPFIITIEHWGETKFTGTNRSDLNASEALDLFICTMKACGFHDESINEALLEYIDTHKIMDEATE